MNLFLIDIKKGIGRRKKDIRLVSMVWMLVLFFVTGILLYQEYGSKYAIESNKRIFGDWAINEIVDNQEKQIQLLPGFAYFDYYGTLVTNLKVRIDAESDIDGMVGYVDANLEKLGYLKCSEGRIPANAGEIAVTPSELQGLGLKYELDQKVTLECLDSASQKWVSKEFTLVGILKDQMSIWSTAYAPKILISPQDGEIMKKDAVLSYFYHLSEQYDIEKFTEIYLINIGRVCSDANREGRLIENSNLYSDVLLNNKTVYITLLILILGAGIAAILFVQTMYVRRRRSFYYCIRTLGASRLQMIMEIVYENVFISVKSALIGIGAAIAICLGSFAVIYLREDINLLELVSAGTILIIIGTWLGLLVLSTIGSIIVANRKKLYSNSQSIPLRFLIRRFLNKLRPRHIYSGIYIRQHKIFKIRSMLGTILGIVTVAVLIFLSSKIYAIYYNFAWNDTYLVDFIGNKNATERLFPEMFSYGNITTTTLDVSLGQYYDGFGEWVYKSVANVPNLKNIRYSTVDNAHLIDWEGRFESPYIEQLNQNVLGSEKYIDENGVVYEHITYAKELIDMAKGTLAMGDQIWFTNDSDIWTKYSKLAQGQRLDRDGFMSGNQVIVRIVGGDSLSGEVYHKDADYNIKAGDVIKIKLNNGDIHEVEVGAVLTVDYMDIFYEHVKLSSLSRAGVYIYASEALGEKLAALEGKIFMHNRLTCNIDYSCNYEPVVKALTNIMGVDTRKGVYNSGGSAVTRHNWYSELMQRISLYGTFMALVIAFYLIARSYIVQAGIVFYGNNVKRLRLLGMEQKKIKRMYFWEGVYESRFIILGLFLGYALKIFEIIKTKGYNLEVAHMQEDGGTELELIRQKLEMQTSIWWSLAIFALVCAVTILSRYFLVKLYLKKQQM